MIGLTSGEAKAQVLRAQGAEVRVLPPGAPIGPALAGLPPLDVIYDSTGTTLLESLAQVRIGGTVVFYGHPPAVPPSVLMDGSKHLVGGDLWNVLTSAEQRQRRADELFGLIGSGRLRVPVAARFALADGAAAHALLEARGTVGKILLLP